MPGPGQVSLCQQVPRRPGRPGAEYRGQHAGFGLRRNKRRRADTARQPTARRLHQPRCPRGRHGRCWSPGRDRHGGIPCNVSPPTTLPEHPESPCTSGPGAGHRPGSRRRPCRRSSPGHAEPAGCRMARPPASQGRTDRAPSHPSGWTDRSWAVMLVAARPDKAGVRSGPGLARDDMSRATSLIGCRVDCGRLATRARACCGSETTETGVWITCQFVRLSLS